MKKKPTTEKLTSEDYHVTEALTAMFAVFNDTVIVQQGRKQKVVEEGTIVKIKAVEVAKPGILRITPVEGDSALVRAPEVRIYTGRVPDWRLEMFLVEHGHQAETYRGVQCVHIECRDFGGDHPISKLTDRLDKLVWGWLSAFRKAL